MPAPTTIRALFHPLENEAKDAEKEKKEQTQHQQRFVESKSTFFSSKFILFFFDSGRKTKEISIPVAFDKQKSNFLIGPSALLVARGVRDAEAAGRRARVTVLL